MKILRDWLINNPRYVSGKCLEIFLNEPHVAYIGELTYLKSVQTDYCLNYTMVILDDRFFPGYLGFALQKNSPINAIISDK